MPRDIAMLPNDSDILTTLVKELDAKLFQDHFCIEVGYDEETTRWAFTGSSLFDVLEHNSVKEADLLLDLAVALEEKRTADTYVDPSISFKSDTSTGCYRLDTK